MIRGRANRPKIKSVNGSESLCLLSTPPPYRGWLALSNDPDFTTWERWQQLHRLIWKDLKLPFADSFFLFNYNETLPDQVNLRDHPEILTAHQHDTMHTWGDFLNSRTRRFTREDAIEGVATLKSLNVTPRVWTDHSNFSGNLLCRASRKAMPYYVDASGHTYPNFEYTLDLIREAGVRYVWDGKVTRLVGQDRHVSRMHWYRSFSSRRWASTLRAVADVIGRPLWNAVDAQAFNYKSVDNRQYSPHQFPDGQVFYRFVRFGKWMCADIDSLASVASRQILNQLVDLGGTCILYTHLGKPNADRIDDPDHIPLESARVFEELARRFQQRDLLLSGTSQLLDYLVLRDHAVVDDRVDFRPDGVRFQSVTPQDLAGIEFGVYSPDGDFQVSCEGTAIPFRKEQVEKAIYRISFDEHSTSSN